MAPAAIQERPSQHNDQREYTITINSDHEIFITVTSSATAADRWIHDTYSDERIVGIGVHWRKLNNDAANDWQFAATLQLCIGCHCLVFQAFHSFLTPPILRSFLLDNRITFVCLQNPYEYTRKLMNSHHNLLLQPDMPIDLRTYIFVNDGNRGSVQCSLREIAKRFLGIEHFQLNDQRKTNWEHRYLTPLQLTYASCRPYLASLLGTRIEIWRLNPFYQYLLH